MHTAFLWLSLAFGLCEAQRVAETDERSGFSPAHDRWRAVLAAPEPRRLARSGWLRVMEEAALVPARRRLAARRAASDPAAH
jgi:hypothetical protein